MKIHKIKKCRIHQGKCRLCKNEISPGQPYKWIKFRYLPKAVFCGSCSPRNSHMTLSEHLSNLYEAQEHIEDCTIDVMSVTKEFNRSANCEDDLKALKQKVETLIEAFDIAIEVAEEEGNSYEDSADNVEEFFSTRADEIREQSDSCYSWQSELESAKYNIKECLDCMGMFTHTDKSEILDITVEIESIVMNTIDGLEI